MTYYLWRDKKSTDSNLLVYITDYKEVRADGKVKIDNHGYKDAELVYSSNNKYDVLSYAQKMK